MKDVQLLVQLWRIVWKHMMLTLANQVTVHFQQVKQNIYHICQINLPSLCQQTIQNYIELQTSV